MHKDDKRRVPSKIFILFAFSMFSKQRRLTTRATTTRATATAATEEQQQCWQHKQHESFTAPAVFPIAI